MYPEEKGKEQGRMTYRISIAMTKDEYERFNKFCEVNRFPKSYFARKSIFQAMADYDNAMKKLNW